MAGVVLWNYNSVFCLPTERNVDIIYILQGTICSRADMETQRRFLDTMPDVPIICLFSSVDGYRSVTFNNKSGLTRVIEHLIEEHDAKEIGFVSGPVTNHDAKERLEVFKKVLEDADPFVSNSFHFFLVCHSFCLSPFKGTSL